MTGLGLALVAGLWGPAAQAAPQADDPLWVAKKEKSVPGVNRKPVPRGADPAEQAAVTATPRVAWPTPGRAEVDVPAPAPATEWATVLAGGRAAGPKARAGGLPVWVGSVATRDRTAAASAPSKVRVELSRPKADGLLLKLARTDGVKQAGRVSVQVNYESFRHAYGGDWALRLRLVRLPACALTKPGTPECVGTPVPTRNNGSGALAGDVPVGPATELYAVQAAASGGTGSFAASALAPTATWQVGSSSGDFAWQYPMAVPPSNGGPAPKLSVDYSSGAVDGRTSATNNQPSWVGQGFDLQPGGSIERRYASCGSKSEQSGNNGTRATGDLCFATDNATFTLNGKGGELVRDDDSGVWRPRNDDGSRVEKLTGAANGDDGRIAEHKGEYWRLTSKDGTKYYFGQNTNSSWTVPVFGNHSGEQCHSVGNFAGSWCQQTYKWNLNYVVDRHGNTMSLFYDTESNYYARNSTATTVSPYIRAGNIARIEYGQRENQTGPVVGRVLFQTTPRCIDSTACNAPAHFPDTPLDKECTSSTNCDNKFNPTFFTKKKLTKVTTEIWRGTAFAPVSSWTFRHTFPDNGDGTQPGLWLEGVTHAGHVGSAMPIPEVNFDGVQMANRVDSVGDGLPEMRWWRMQAINYGTGGQLAIAYSGQDCKPLDTPPADTNGRRCHPMKWTPPGSTTEQTSWFHKYVVVKVEERDRATGLEPVVTSLEYPRPPAWRHDDEDGLVEVGQKTWSQWRGYDLVIVKKGKADGPQIVTENRYYRGMDGDKTAVPDKFKDEKITDSTGGEVDDLLPLAGQVREQRTFDGTQLVSRTISDQWVSKATATRKRSWGIISSFQTEQAGNKQAETLADGKLRQSAANNNYDATGLLLSRNDLNDLTKADDDTCTYYEYTKNDAQGIDELPKREKTVSVACDRPYTNEQVLAATQVYYDNATSPDAAPVKGDVTRTERLNGFAADGKPTYQTVQTVKYDALGRSIEMRDALDQVTTTSYTPAAGGPVTKAVVTKPNGHTTTVELEPAWGEQLATTDESGKRTEATYDALGRTDKVWWPGRTGAEIPAGDPASKAGGNVAGQAAAADNPAVPNVDYDYRIDADAANVVTTKTLQTDGSIETAYQFSDGLMRPRQTQEAAPGGAEGDGRLVHDVIYDSRGLEVKEFGPYFNSAAPNPHEVLHPVEAALPTAKFIEYDLAGRPKAEIFKSENVEKWRTTHAYAADRQTIDPPAGDQPTTKITDLQGRITELRQYLGDSPTGVYDTTSYTYTPSGQLAAVTDPAGNKWSFEYDLRGRKVKDHDPDKGSTEYTYNDLDQLVTLKDARGNTQAYAYDTIGRKTAIHEGSLQGRKRAEWTYDALSKGMPVAWTRYDAEGNAYTSRVTGYDAAGRATGTEIVIPESEGELAGTYAFASTYKADGQLDTETLPGVGGLPAETLTHGYDKQDQLTTLASADTSYVRGTSYTAYGEVEKVTLGATNGKWVEIGYDYETGTRRLSSVTTQRETLPRRVSHVAYAYDDGGNVQQITDTPSSTSGEAADTQCFDYDHLRRLTAAWTPSSGDCGAAPTAAGLGGPAPYWHSWTFDKTGNRKTETRTSATGSTTAEYTYPAAGQARPHAVSKVVTTGTGMPAGGKTDTYDYNETGDLKARTRAGVGETFTWNAEGELEKVTKAGQETSFLYDANGDRLIRRDASGTTLYLQDTELLLKPGAAEAEGTRYYKHGDQTVAVRTGGKLTWLGADHHGTSTTAIDNTAQQTVQRRRQDPYGNTRGTAPAAWPGQRGFVGGTNDPSTGLVHLGAREYDPTIGRFISVDPQIEIDDPQTLNAYTYANNNPVTFTDPDGMSWFSSVVSSIKTVTEKVVNRVSEKVKEAVQVVTPVINWVVDEARKTMQAVQTFVKKTVEVVKTVVKTVTTTVKKAVKTFHTIKKFVAKVAKPVVAKVKAVAKQAAKVAQAVAHKAAAAAQKAASWVYEHRQQIMMVVAEIALTVAIGALTGGVGALAVRGAITALRMAASAKRLHSASSAVAQSSKTLLRTPLQLQKKFKHAKDFDVTGNYNKKNAAEFSRAIHKHINAPGTRQIQGTLHGKPATHYLDPVTARNVTASPSGEFISGWTLKPVALSHVLKNGALGGH